MRHQQLDHTGLFGDSEETRGPQRKQPKHGWGGSRLPYSAETLLPHGWNVQPALNAGVNLPLPSAEEREEMRAIDAKLDAFVTNYKG
jgi:hypothetical protein